jgi:hypothetical protein
MSRKPSVRRNAGFSVRAPLTQIGFTKVSSENLSSKETFVWAPGEYSHADVTQGSFEKSLRFATQKNPAETAPVLHCPQ